MDFANMIVRDVVSLFMLNFWKNIVMILVGIIIKSADNRLIPNDFGEKQQFLSYATHNSIEFYCLRRMDFDNLIDENYVLVQHHRGGLIMMSISVFMLIFF